MNERAAAAETHANPAPLAEELRCTGASLRRTMRRLSQVYDDALKPFGIKLTQYSVLNGLTQAEGPSITDLAEALMMDRTTLTRNLQPLQKAGWVAFGRSGDARSRRLVLTPEGRKVLEAARPVWRETELAIRRRLGGDGGDTLRRLLADACTAFSDLR